MNQSSSQAALELSDALLDDLELTRLPLVNCFMKGCRLARLVGDGDMLDIFQYELAGYPSGPNGVTSEVWALAKRANRVYEDKGKDKEVRERCYTTSIEALEGAKTSAETRLLRAQHPLEGSQMRKAITNANGRIAERREFIYAYVLRLSLIHI